MLVLKHEKVRFSFCGLVINGRNFNEYNALSTLPLSLSHTHVPMHSFPEHLNVITYF